MRPKRYPYSGKKELAFVKVDPELVESFLRKLVFLEHLQSDYIIAELRGTNRK